MIVTVAVVVPLSLYRVFRRGEEFAHHREKVNVVSSSMTLEAGERGPLVVVRGTLRNDSPVPWKRVQMEVQFFDGEGKMVDVLREPVLGEEPGVLPGRQAVFVLKSRRDFREELYVSHQTFIRHADDGRYSW